MFSKIIKWLALLSCIGLIICCFLPWAYFTDLKVNFTGFYSNHNEYGRPGVFIVPMALVACLLILLDKLWAKRANLFVSALLLGYIIKSYVLFTGCYIVYCPVKQPAIYLLPLFAVLVLAGAIFPGMKIVEKENV
jgi:hypothetical protein